MERGIKEEDGNAIEIVGDKLRQIKLNIMTPGELSIMEMAYETFMKRAYQSTDTANYVYLSKAVITNLIRTKEGLGLKHLGTCEEQFVNLKEYLRSGFDKLIEQKRFSKQREEIIKIKALVDSSTKLKIITDHLSEVNKLTRDNAK